MIVVDVDVNGILLIIGDGVITGAIAAVIGVNKPVVGTCVVTGAIVVVGVVATGATIGAGITTAFFGLKKKYQTANAPAPYNNKSSCFISL